MSAMAMAWHSSFSILYHDLRYGPTTTDKFVGKDNGIFTTTSKNVRESEEIVEKIERSLVKRGL
uniref:Uncharacterized protein n=1 Tax=Pristionchus pacificus TaxID=54126 RepID=A0A2A6C722_PRIPA|eukprot:PDM73821.1 hypothetical protein PRIPAC_41177 [Pristionchus pacificus]